MSAPPLIRKHMQRFEIPGGVRFVTFSCQRRLPLFGRAAIRDVFADALTATRRDHGLHLFAWVVMPDHVHLLVRPGSAPLADSLRSIKTSVAKQVIDRWKHLQAPILGRITTEQGSPRFWQKGGGFDRNVRTVKEFSHEVQYIHRNPVKRGLVSLPQEWKWSSARWWMGQREGEVECDPPPGDAEGWATWKGSL